jgi:hypothetical protein
MASLCFQRPPSPRSFGFLVDVVGELRIRGRGFAAQAAGVRMTSLHHRIQLAVDLDVDPAHEEGRYALQSFQRPAAGETLFQPLEKGLEDSAIPLDRKDQGTLTEMPAAKVSVMAGSPARVAGIFMKRLGRSMSHHNPRASAAVRAAS